MPAIDYLNRGPGTKVISHSVPFDEIGSAEVLQLRAYIDEIRGDRALASKADLDPAEIKELLPLLALMEITVEPLTVFYRLFGTSLVALYGELTGSYLHDRIANPDLRDEALKSYQRLIVEKAPIYGVTELEVGSNRERAFEWAFFPLSSDGVAITHALYIEQRSEKKPRF